MLYGVSYRSCRRTFLGSDLGDRRLHNRRRGRHVGIPLDRFDRHREMFRRTSQGAADVAQVYTADLLLFPELADGGR